MAYKVIFNLTPAGYFLGFISCHCNLSSLPTATLAFCLIIKRSEFIPTSGPLYLLFPVCNTVSQLVTRQGISYHLDLISNITFLDHIL